MIFSVELFIVMLFIIFYFVKYLFNFEIRKVLKERFKERELRKRSYKRIMSSNCCIESKRSNYMERVFEYCTPTSKSSKKRVKFYSLVNVVLIPTRLEFHQAGLVNSLWWDAEDYVHFKQKALSEVNEYAKMKNLNLLTAIIHLYQPDEVINNSPT
jgi:hypothetical protein